MPSETPEGHFEYPDLHELRWYKNGEVIEIEGTTAEQTHDGIVDWLEQLEIRLTGIVEEFGDLPSPDPERVDPRTGNERIYLVRNRETFYRDAGDQWVVTGGDEGDAVGAGAGLVLTDSYEVDFASNFTWTGKHTFDDSVTAFRVGDQGTSPTNPGEFTRNGSDVLVHTGGSVVSLSDVGTGGSGGGGTDVISSPNLSIPYTELADGERVGNPVSLADGEMIEVRMWGVSDTDGNTPAGLAVQLRDETDSIVDSAETPWDASPTGITSYENTSGVRQTVSLTVNNATGTNYADPNGVGAQFGYVIE